ncbi:zinc ribbon domain-containing protein [bacterium]|nr:zinc ribbon domain-containing protein [bacterium]RIK56409.1 MAG: FmdB family transcriptional regulator [candidate division KSB1 bacterium]
MPTYDYDCSTCGQTTELFQSISAPPLEICPRCGGKVTRRISGGTGLIFKGSGFYLTDYKNASSKDGSGAAGKTKEGAAGDKSNNESKDSKTSKEKSAGEGEKKKTESPVKPAE